MRLLSYQRMPVDTGGGLPASLQSWLGHELEVRGIDAVIYTRYILSILQQDASAEDVELGDMSDFFTESSPKALSKTNAGSKWAKKFENEKGEIDIDLLRKAAAVQCLTNVSEEAAGIENLVEELYVKLQEERNKKDKAQKKAPVLEDDTNCSHSAEERYYEAFPALSDKCQELTPKPQLTPDDQIWAKVARRSLGNSPMVIENLEGRGEARSKSVSPAKEQKNSHNRETKMRYDRGGFSPVYSERFRHNRKSETTPGFVSLSGRKPGNPQEARVKSQKKLSPREIDRVKGNSPRERYAYNKGKSVDMIKGRALFSDGKTSMKSSGKCKGERVNSNERSNRSKSEEAAPKEAKTQSLTRSKSDSMTMVIDNKLVPEDESCTDEYREELVEDWTWYIKPIDEIVTVSPVPKQRLYMRNFYISSGEVSPADFGESINNNNSKIHCESNNNLNCESQSGDNKNEDKSSLGLSKLRELAKNNANDDNGENDEAPQVEGSTEHDSDDNTSEFQSDLLGLSRLLSLASLNSAVTSSVKSTAVNSPDPHWHPGTPDSQWNSPVGSSPGSQWNSPCHSPNTGEPATTKFTEKNETQTAILDHGDGHDLAVEQPTDIEDILENAHCLDTFFGQSFTSVDSAQESQPSNTTSPTFKEGPNLTVKLDPGLDPKASGDSCVIEKLRESIQEDDLLMDCFNVSDLFVSEPCTPVNSVPSPIGTTFDNHSCSCPRDDNGKPCLPFHSDFCLKRHSIIHSSRGNQGGTPTPISTENDVPDDRPRSQEYLGQFTNLECSSDINSYIGNNLLNDSSGEECCSPVVKQRHYAETGESCDHLLGSSLGSGSTLTNIDQADIQALFDCDKPYIGAWHSDHAAIHSGKNTIWSFSTQNSNDVDYASLWGEIEQAHTNSPVHNSSPLKDYFTPGSTPGKQSQIWDVNVHKKLDFDMVEIPHEPQHAVDDIMAYLCDISVPKTPPVVINVNDKPEKGKGRKGSFIEGGIYGNEWKDIVWNDSASDVQTESDCEHVFVESDSEWDGSLLKPCYSSDRSCGSEKGFNASREDSFHSISSQISGGSEILPSENSAFSNCRNKKNQNQGVNAELLLEALSLNPVEPKRKHVQIKHLYNADTSILRELGLASGTDCEAVDEEVMVFSPERHFKPITTPPNSPQPPPKPQETKPPPPPKQPSPEVTFSLFNRSSSYQLYCDGDDDLEDAIFIPSFKVHKECEKCAQTGDSPQVTDEPDKSLTERLLKDMKRVLTIEEEEEEEESIASNLTIEDINDSIQAECSSDYESMLFESSGDELQVNTIAEIWGDNHTEKVEERSKPSSVVEILKDNYKTIWSLGTDSDIPCLPSGINQTSLDPVNMDPNDLLEAYAAAEDNFEAYLLHELNMEALVVDEGAGDVMTPPPDATPIEKKRANRKDPEWMIDGDVFPEAAEFEEMLINYEPPNLPLDQVVYSTDLEHEWLSDEKHNFEVQVPKPKPKSKLGPSKKPCTFFMEGNCRRADCKFSHDVSRITCRFWEHGDCFKGPTCPFLHGYCRYSPVEEIEGDIELPCFSLEDDFPALDAEPSPEPKPRRKSHKSESSEDSRPRKHKAKSLPIEIKYKT